MELLLVVLIIGMTSSVAIPSFVNSMKGARLRTSVRSVVALNRYARSISVLKQKEVAVVYHTGLNRLELVIIKSAGTAGRFEDAGLMFGDRPSVEASVNASGGHQEEKRQIRNLGEGVQILEFISDVEDQPDEEDVYVALYYPNGMCDSHEVVLEDKRGMQAIIAVEPATSKVSVEYAR